MRIGLVTDTYVPQVNGVSTIVRRSVEALERAGHAGRRYALEHRVPLVTSFHTDFPRYARHCGAGALAPLVWRWLTWFHSPAALTLTPGDGTRGELVRHGITAARVWGRGVDARHFQPARRDPAWRRWLAGGDDTTVVLHVGRLAPEKNLEILVAGGGSPASDWASAPRSWSRVRDRSSSAS